MAPRGLETWTSAPVRAGNGVEVLAPEGVVHLDPARPAPWSVVTHAHEDHLPTGGKGARRGKGSADDVRPSSMTPPTLDILRLRRPAATGTPLEFDHEVNMAGARLALHRAGHVLGSAMARVETPHGTVLYTGDFSPTGGTTSGKATAEPCDFLVIESTYGEPRFTLPPRDLVLANLETWALRRMLSGSVALGSHPLGRAQELIAFLNRCGIVPVVSGEIAQIAAIYNAHGQDLAWTVLGSPRDDAGHRCYVVPHGYLRKDHPFASRLASEDGAGAYLSGWCQAFSYFERYFIETQFPLTDHATFPELLSFVEACAPKEVFVVHGRPAVFAAEVRRRLDIPARPLALDPPEDPRKTLVPEPAGTAPDALREADRAAGPP
ncbi:MAG: MBL fold metallo-hydrolase RNA specificity domain-containing protein [Thermoplasmatota archaeon]